MMTCMTLCLHEIMACVRSKSLPEDMSTSKHSLHEEMTVCMRICLHEDNSLREDVSACMRMCLCEMNLYEDISLHEDMPAYAIWPV